MTPRRLAAILAADVVGFSRLIGADEAATLARLRALRAETIDPLMAEHHGRVFKTTGDGLLAEFPSAVQALRCALAIQHKQRDTEDPLQLRIGLHQGDVVIEGDDLLGDGVNIAARLEPLADPGGIVLSARIREDITGKIAIETEDLGTPALKNIAHPIRVYRVRPPAAERPALPLPDKPSLAVLPFQNMSGDPEQDYFADGVVEDIITALSRAGWFFVIARNSSFAYKGQSPDIRTVGRELGVRYVVEGSVRRAGSRVRITCQLIEAATGHHIWADRFDGELADIFDLQDRITESVVGAIEPNLKRAEVARANAKPTESLDAYDLYLRASQLHRSRTGPDLNAAAAFLRRALNIDPNYPRAKALLSTVYVTLTDSRLAPAEAGPTGPYGEIALALARDALATAADDPETLSLAAAPLVYFEADYPAALTALQRAIRLHANFTAGLVRLGWVQCMAMSPDPAIECFQRAMRLSPIDPEIGLMLAGLGVAHSIAGRDSEALPLLQRALREAPNLTAAHRALILTLTRLGRPNEAREAAARAMAIRPGLVARDRVRTQYTEEYLNERTDALLAAGVPE